MPESAAEGLDALSARLQGLPDTPMEDTERRGLLVRMLEAAPPPVFEALAVMATTGENALDALTTALREYQPDFYEAMKAGGCMWPGCETRQGVHFHHLPIDESTKRGNEVGIIFCPYHHNQDGSHPHAHAMTRWDVYEAFGGEARFWMAVSIRYAQAAQVVKGRQA